MSELVLVSNITLIFLQDYVSSSCGDVPCLLLCFHINISKIQEEGGKRYGQKKTDRVGEKKKG